MTIKEFAQLCSCNAQTLRYYDRIGLLCPRKVDQWSRYRYYDAKQALDFIRIKNLQSADFTIEEIKQLLKKSDAEIFEAFDQKIRQQEEKLSQIKKIQQSYLQEKNAMEKMLKCFTDFLMTALRQYDGLDEFALSPEEKPAIEELIGSYLESSLLQLPLPEPQEVTLKIDQELIQGADQVMQFLDGVETISEEVDFILNYQKEPADASTDADWISVWESHEWRHVHEFIGQIPLLEPEKEYRFHFCMNNEMDVSKNDFLAFSLYMIGAMLKKNPGCRGIKCCLKDDSQDGKNHFYLESRN